MKHVPRVAFVVSAILALFGGGLALGIASSEVNLWPSRIARDIYGPMTELPSPSDAILVVDEEMLAIKFISSGDLVRQHDPDFVSGDVISVFHNRMRTRAARNSASRIFEFNGRTGEISVRLDGRTAERRRLTGKNTLKNASASVIWPTNRAATVAIFRSGGSMSVGPCGMSG